MRNRDHNPAGFEPKRDTYKIIRFYQGDHPNRTIDVGLSLAEAQEHCRDPETSSSTCVSAASKRITTKMGPWFDGYEQE